MKVLYIVLTVLFWLAVLAALITLLRMITAGGPIPELLGGVIGCALIPGLIYLIRYFVAKKMR